MIVKLHPPFFFRDQAKTWLAVGYFYKPEIKNVNTSDKLEIKAKANWQSGRDILNINLLWRSTKGFYQLYLTATSTF